MVERSTSNDDTPHKTANEQMSERRAFTHEAKPTRAGPRAGPITSQARGAPQMVQVAATISIRLFRFV
jgi:hypothetical protein